MKISFDFQTPDSISECDFYKFIKRWDVRAIPANALNYAIARALKFTNFLSHVGAECTTPPPPPDVSALDCKQ